MHVHAEQQPSLQHAPDIHHALPAEQLVSVSLEHECPLT